MPASGPALKEIKRSELLNVTSIEQVSGADLSLAELNAVFCIMHAMAMIILTVPIIFPVVTHLGFDPIWFGVIIVMTVELGLIHPPVGMNVFVIKSVVKDVSFATIFKGVIPFVLTDLVRLVILIAFPLLAL
jgi:TRAP-type C4-dicarboxylate transport system permease large subunit